MGVNAHIAINQMWKEPAILWFIIASYKGQKKTAALRLLKKPLQEIDNEEARKWATQHGNEQNESPPQLSIDNFRFEELHNVMSRNGSQILGLFDEMSTMYGQLDLYKQSGSVMDSKMLITLIWQFMVKKLSKLYNFNEQDHFQQGWLHSACFC